MPPPPPSLYNIAWNDGIERGRSSLHSLKMGAQLSAISGNKRRGLLEALYNTTPTGRTLGSAVGSSGPARASRTGRRLAVGAVHDSAELLEGTRRGGRAMPLGYLSYPHHARGLSWTDVGLLGVCQTLHRQTNPLLHSGTCRVSCLRNSLII